VSAHVAAPRESANGDVSLIAPSFIAVVNGELEAFISSHSSMLVGIHSDLDLLAEAARAAVLQGGKRLRPSFAYWGWRAVQSAGAEGEEVLIRAASSLELLHACALVHDDLMDSSDTRRGRPAAHIGFAAEHARRGWSGTPTTFGTAGAILLGDLLLSWAEEMFTAAITGLPAYRATAAVREFDLMRTEVVAGQFLDVLAQTRGAFDVDEALRVITFKTSKYTIQRPLLLGARAADADAKTIGALAGYGHTLGEAFQLRDDLLGVYGDPEQTGKPAGDDLREGKRTLLVALAARASNAEQLKVLHDGIGRPDLDPDGVAELRQVLTATGARSAVERRIADRVRQAELTLEAGLIATDSRDALVDLAHAAAHRTF
jgi:geranylgeranyl diphosphate synthase, type I